MKRLPLAAVLLLGLTSAALAQSAPHDPAMTYGMVPTVGQWNNWFEQKQDTLGYTPVNRGGDSMQGKLNTLAPTSSGAGFNLSPGSSPASPADGDLWTTNDGLYVRIDGKTVGPIRNGNVQGPSVSVVGHVPTFSTTDGSAIQDSGKSLPSGAIVGTTDAQTLTNKQIDASEITSGVIGYGFLPIGTTAGTVAAGNDSRIMGALQTTGGTMTGSIGANLGPEVAGLNVSGNTADAVYGIGVFNSGSGSATAFNVFANGLSGPNGVGAGQSADGSAFLYVQGHTYDFDKNGNLTGATNLATISSLAPIATSGSASDLSTGTVPSTRLPLPGASSTGAVLSSTAPANQFATGINTSGAVTYAQPSIGQISGAATVASTGSAADLTTGQLPCGRLANGGYYSSPFCYGAVGNGRSTDDTAAVQAAWNALQTAQAAGAQWGVLDLRGGTFAISAAITPTAGSSPFDLRITNGTIIPYGSYAGNLLDFSGATATTDVRFDNLSLNGWGQAANLLKLSPKSQGVWIDKDTFTGFTNSAIWDPTTAAGTELKITSNTIQGGTTTNVGTGVIISGNDAYVTGNVIRNVSVGIRTTNAAVTITGNHIYSVDINTPIADIWASTGLQMQINDNYIDEGYIYIEDPSRGQINNNKFLLAGAPAGGTVTTPRGSTVAFAPIILAPQSASFDMFDWTVVGNNFDNEGGGGPYSPVGVDTTNGSITSCQTTNMANNGFSGYNPKHTEPWIQGTLSGVTTLSIDFTAFIPWCSPQYIEGYTLLSAGSVTATGISGNVASLTTAASYTGTYSIRTTVNSLQ